MTADNRHKSLVDFRNNLRTFHVHSIDKERTWEEVAQVRQIVKGVSRPIQIVGNEVNVLQMRVAELLPAQLFR